MKLKIKYISKDSNINPIVSDKGEWFDLCSAETVHFNAPHNAYNTRITTFDVKKVSLGIAMQLPKGIEAYIVSRSSLYEKKGLSLTNSIGIIDSSYCGNDDIWKAPLRADRETCLEKYEKIVQFRVQLSQKASLWTKFKWLFVSKIEFIKVESLNNINRGGFGSTGGYSNMK